MLLKRLRPRLVAVAALLTVTSFTIADAAVTITAPARNANIASGALITVTGTATGTS